MGTRLYDQILHVFITAPYSKIPTEKFLFMLVFMRCFCSNLIWISYRYERQVWDFKPVRNFHVAKGSRPYSYCHVNLTNLVNLVTFYVAKGNQNIFVLYSTCFFILSLCLLCSLLYLCDEACKIIFVSYNYTATVDVLDRGGGGFE